MAVSPGKIFKSFSNKVWSGRARRIARIIDANADKRAQENGEPTPPKTTPGSTG